ncbi:MAG: EthD domain-containing protein, partial [Proteobacteria bacterium]|nr:EthD domain-containing protein [Pseudomonadota bacterium]
MIRMTWLLRRPAGIPAADFTARWRDEHGPLVAAHQARLGILRYVQTHRDAASADAEAAASAKRGGLDAPYDGVEEYWFGSDATLAAARGTVAGRAAEAEIAAHAATFVERGASPLWLGHEFPQIATQRERVVARPRTGIVRVHFAIRARPPLSAAEARHYWLTTHGPLVRSHAVARGTLCYLQVHRHE